MKNMLLASAVLATVIALVNSPAWADEPETAAETPAAETPFRVVRLGDNQMSCEALIAEMDELNLRVQSHSDEMTRRSTEMTRTAMRAGRGGGMAQGMGMTLGSLAASFIPGGALVASAAQTVVSTAAQAQAQAQQDRAMQDMEDMTAAMTEGTSELIPVTQRIEHLGEITRDKGC